MSNSSKRKPRSKQNQQPRELKPDQLQKGGWAVKAIASKSMSTIIVLIGLISGLIVFIPRVTVEPSGDISNPSSISVKVKNMGNIPLRNPLMDTLGCRIALGNGHEVPPDPKECIMSHFPPEPPDMWDRPWLDIDGYYTTGLGDHTFFLPPNAQITYLNIVIRIGYYPYYLPFRQYKLFGFRSWRGTTDGKLYWRDYTPDPIPDPDYFWALQVPRYPGDIGFPL
jgi:hypothetical protein